MTGKQILRCGAGLLIALTLASCDDTQPTGQGFKTQYLAARAALEGGQYAKANRAYARLLPSAGPLSARIRLEFAHSLLRAGEPQKALNQAAYLVSSETGLARGAALAVQGTAQHELGLAALANGDPSTGKSQLLAAQASINDVLTSHPELDPLGALAGRKASIAVRLRAL